MLVGNDNKLQILMACGHFYRFTLHLACLLAAPPGFHQPVVPHHLDNAAIDRAARLEKPACCGIRKLDESLCIRDEHAIGNLIQEGGKARALRFQRRMLNVEGRYKR